MGGAVMEKDGAFKGLGAHRGVLIPCFVISVFIFIMPVMTGQA
jgi:hypothetical protein